MAFTIYDKQPGGDTGEISIGLAGEATEIWTIIADNGLHTIEDLRQSGLLAEPYVNVHAQNPRLLLRPHKIAQDTDNPAVFYVTVNWKSEPLTPQEKKEQQEDEANPLDRTPRIVVETAFRTEVRHRDRYGKSKVNSAGDLFDPPLENNATYLIITIRKNVTVFPDWAFDYADGVNSVSFTILGRVFPAGTAWIAKIRLGEAQEDNGVVYCEASIEINVRKKREPVGSETSGDVPSPWQTEQLDEGLMAYDLAAPAAGRYRIKVKDEDDKDVYPTGPVPLDGAGKPYLPGPGQTREDYIDNMKYLVFRDHLEVDFNDLSFLWT